MSASRPGDWPAPTPADLAAYVDEELEPAQRQLVEVWLRAHPEVAAELEGQRDIGHAIVAVVAYVSRARYN